VSHTQLNINLSLSRLLAKRGPIKPGAARQTGKDRTMERSPRRRESGNAKAESCTTRESRGFGFVAMGPVEEVEAVVTARNATELGSRSKTRPWLVQTDFIFIPTLNLIIADNRFCCRFAP
jgi:hypothetical protein